MTFSGFNKQDFDTFTIPGLEPRMDELKETIRPKLTALGEEIAPYLSEQLGEEMNVHVAKHARRSVHPPDETWVAWSAGKRGYKATPHFQVGLRKENLFAMFAIIYEYPNKPGFSKDLQEQMAELFSPLPSTYRISPDHTQPQTYSLAELGSEGIHEILERLAQVKKAEFMIGIELDRNQATRSDGQTLIEEIKKTFASLASFYRIAVLAAQ
ncbi:YktB family protein [Marininema halotolerans]|uniref:UPF0637 protein SAMN05444972_12026 n=1 Tax=Marininema halotolerans TaxID=1155944 RepID=A0A1I6UTQ1_9BACL|nr:DUF1054 domain-containing protein [Marininema halotolerans]SFT04737.1 Uncharacterized protein YktB, UPF0637 family [Marininema halotolerans]